MATKQQNAIRKINEARDFINECNGGNMPAKAVSELNLLETKIKNSYPDMFNFPKWKKVLDEIIDFYSTCSNFPRRGLSLEDADDFLKEIYWRDYGDIGQKLVENSKYIKNLLKKDYKIMDGDNKVTGKFSNLPEFMHLDIVIYDSKKHLIKGICEVKTTKIKLKREFKANGKCARVMGNARLNGIPLFLAIVRLNGMLPTEIVTNEGFTETLEKFKKDKSLYQIEFYKEGEFELRDGLFQIK